MKLYEQAGLSPNLDAVRAEQKPGRRAFCGKPLLGRQTRHCGRPVCKAEYQKAASLDVRHRARLAVALLRESRKAIERAQHFLQTERQHR